MKDKVNTGKKRGLTPLDVFVILICVICVAGVAVRALVGRDDSLPAPRPESSEYALSFELTGARADAGGYFTVGEALYTEDGVLFGTVRDQVSVTPAKIYSVDEEGHMVLSYSGADNGDGSLVDIKGTLTVEGFEADYGFLAGGKLYAAPNCEITLHTSRTTAHVRVTGITPVGD